MTWCTSKGPGPGVKVRTFKLAAIFKRPLTYLYLHAVTSEEIAGAHALTTDRPVSSSIREGMFERGDVSAVGAAILAQAVRVVGDGFAMGGL